MLVLPIDPQAAFILETSTLRSYQPSHVLFVIQRAVYFVFLDHVLYLCDFLFFYLIFLKSPEQ